MHAKILHKSQIVGFINEKPSKKRKRPIQPVIHGAVERKNDKFVWCLYMSVEREGRFTRADIDLQSAVSFLNDQLTEVRAALESSE